MDSEAVLESRNLRQSSQMDSWQTVFVFRVAFWGTGTEIHRFFVKA